MKFPTKKLTQSIFNGYKTLSVKSLGLAVTPTVMGDVPESCDDTLTFYVLDEYSRANSILLEQQTQEAHLPSALNAVQNGVVDESSAMIFLKHRRGKSELSPRLERLIQACLDNPTLNIRLIPVTILWGRSPDKEDSWFKLLMSDGWQAPTISKQLFNIGVMGRDTFVQFYKGKNLQTLIAEYQNNPNNTDQNQEALATAIAVRLKGYLQKQRASILGPDLSDRRNISNTIINSPNVQDAIMAKAQETGKPIKTIKKEAQSYIDEIASDYSYSVVRVFDRFLSRLWTQLYDGVQVRHFERVRELAPDYQVIYVPCHRSHMDYLLLSYVVHIHGLRVPNVAAGANLNIPILGEILRSSGAFFMRRSFKGNPLYSTVFKEYVYNLMQRNTPIEYYVEGGRSRSGRLLTPRLGMLAMTVNSYLRSPAKPVVFIPTYISYERIMEGATYVGELKGKPKESENLLGLIKTARKIERIFGTVNLSFGEPLFLDNFIEKFKVDTKNAEKSPIIIGEATDLTEKSADDVAKMDDNEQKINAMVQNLGVKIMQHINRTAVVNPVSLVALVLLSTPKSALDEGHFLTQLDLYQKIAQLLPYDKDTAITDMSPKDMLAYAQKLKLITRTPHLLGDVIQVADKQAPMLSYFRNNILHVFIIPSLLAALVQRNGRILARDLHEVSRLLYPFLQGELFLKYALRNIEGVISQALQVLIDTKVVVDLGDGIIASPDGNSEDYQKLVVLASPAQQSLERYFMTLALLDEQGSGKLTLEQVVNLAHLVGGRVSVLYGDDLPDLFDKGLFTNFLNTLIRIKAVDVNEGGYLCFDERIATIAHYARLVLSPDAMTLLHHSAQLTEEELLSITQDNSKDNSKRQNKR